MKMNKIFAWDELKRRLDIIRQEGKKVVFTNGCFDLLHVGHIRYLKEAKKQGDVLVVALNSDVSVRCLKGDKRPIIPLSERMEIVAALEMVDFVTFFNEPTPEELIRFIEPDVLVKGGDWSEDTIVGGDFVRSRGGRVVALTYVEGRSTSDLISQIVTRYR
ncbi:MAG: D-glycero-beta-D-manno-heptose 1-phosphate adenylyltransferase [Syntrophales bacterium]|nr:D-glycero-beta-D-manno-heptose 1-phosphate adenylyltransferase [Syntrophales bacterium]